MTDFMIGLVALALFLQTFFSWWRDYQAKKNDPHDSGFMDAVMEVPKNQAKMAADAEAWRVGHDLAHAKMQKSVDEHMAVHRGTVSASDVPVVKPQ